MKNLPRRKSLFIGLNVFGLCVSAGSIALSIYHLHLAEKAGKGVGLEKSIVLRDFKKITALTIFSGAILACIFFMYTRLPGKLNKGEMDTSSAILTSLVFITPLALLINWSLIKDFNKKLDASIDVDIHVVNILFTICLFLFVSISIYCLSLRDAREFGDLPLSPTPSFVRRDPYDIIMEYYSNKKEEISPPQSNPPRSPSCI